MSHLSVECPRCKKYQFKMFIPTHDSCRCDTEYTSDDISYDSAKALEGRFFVCKNCHAEIGIRVDHVIRLTRRITYDSDK